MYPDEAGNYKEFLRDILFKANKIKYLINTEKDKESNHKLKILNLIGINRKTPKAVYINKNNKSIYGNGDDSVLKNILQFNQNKIKRDLSLIIASGKRLSNLINDILNYLRQKNNEIIIQHIEQRYEIAYDTIIQSLQVQEEKIRYAKKSKKRKLLIVDNDNINIQILINYISTGNYTLTAAHNGKEALDKIKTENFDLVLLDIMMPGMSGFDVCRYIRRDYKLYELPVLMLTIKSNITDIKEGFNAGANDYVSKPFDREELFSRINTLISLKEAADQLEELKNNIEIIISNIPEGVMLVSPELEIRYANDRLKELFNIKGDSDSINLKELFDKEIYKNIHNFIKTKKDKKIFEWITGAPEQPILISIILKNISTEFILVVITEIKDVLAEKELQTCYHIIRGYSERETAKILYKSRTTINSNKIRAREKLKQNNLKTLVEKLL